MSKEHSHIDFDRTLRDKFEDAETPTTQNNWEKLEKNLQETNQPFDSIFRNRFAEETLPLDSPTPDFIQPTDSKNPKTNKRWNWLLWLLLSTLIPIVAYNFLKKPSSRKGSSMVTKEIARKEKSKKVEQTSNTPEYANRLEENNSTTGTTTDQLLRPRPVVKKQGFTKIGIRSTTKRSINQLTNLKPKDILPPSKAFIIAPNNERNKKSSENKTHRTSRISHNKIEEPNNLSGKKNLRDYKTPQTRDGNAQLKEPSRNKIELEKRSKQRSKIEPKTSSGTKNSPLANGNIGTSDQKRIPRLLSKKERRKKNKEAKKKGSTLNTKPKEITDALVTKSSSSEKTSDEQLTTIDPTKQIGKIRIGVGAYAQRPITKTSSPNSIYQTRYKQGEIKKWEVNAELQTEYRLNQKWSIGSGISMSSYATSTGTNSFDRNKINNIHLDTTNKMLLYQSSLGQAQANSLNGFEFGRTILNNLGSPKDTLNKFTYEEVQSFQFIQIPLFIQYTAGKGNLHYSIGVGPQLSLVTKSSSSLEIYNTAFPSDKVTLTNYHKINKLLWGTTARLGLHYDVSDRLGVYLRPTFSYRATDFSKISLLSIYHHNLRIPLGINFIF